MSVMLRRNAIEKTQIYSRIVDFDLVSVRYHYVLCSLITEFRIHRITTRTGK